GTTRDRQTPWRLGVVELPRDRRARLEAQGTGHDRAPPLLRTYPGSRRGRAQAVRLDGTGARPPTLGRSRGRPQVSVYSGPEPPPGGVRRPPLAVIAPHWTQFDGLSSSSTRPSSPAGPGS